MGNNYMFTWITSQKQCAFTNSEDKKLLPEGGGAAASITPSTNQKDCANTTVVSFDTAANDLAPFRDVVDLYFSR